MEEGFRKRQQKKVKKSYMVLAFYSKKSFIFAHRFTKLATQVGRVVNALVLCDLSCRGKQII
jgi:hypothetical protein